MSLAEALAERAVAGMVVVGIGNPLRGDDAAGCLVARRLRPAPGLRVIEAQEVPESYLDAIVAGRPGTIVLVDAVALGAPPGAVALLDPRELAPQAASTHRVPLAVLAAWLAREAGSEVVVLAIQPAHTELGAPVSAAVEHAAALVASLLERAAREACEPAGACGPRAGAGRC
jgi:hydrogenase 3 maturation protease